MNKKNEVLKFVIQIKHKMNGKFKNNIEAELSFNFLPYANVFSNPSLKIKQGTIFGIPESDNVRTSEKLNHNARLINDRYREVFEEFEMGENITPELCTIFSQNVSKSLKLSTTIEDVKISVPFLQTIFNGPRQREDVKMFSVSLENYEPTSVVHVGSIDSFASNLNLVSILQNTFKEIPVKTIANTDKEKFLKMYSRNELSAVLTTFLTKDLSWRDIEVVSGLESTKKINGGGWKSKDIIEDFWKLSLSDRATFSGYSESVIQRKIEEIWYSNSKNEETNEAQSSVKLLRNDGDSSVQKYIKNTFTGGEFIGTTGYLSLNLLVDFIKEKDSMIDRMSLGIGQFDTDTEAKEYLSNISFISSDKEMWPSYKIIDNSDKIASALKSEKYEFYTNKNKLLHAKTYLYNNQLIVGSSNWTYFGSLKGNEELSLVTDNKNALLEYKDWVAKVKEDTGVSDIKSKLVKYISDSSVPVKREILLAKVMDKLMSDSDTADVPTVGQYIKKSDVYQKLLPHQKDAFKYIIDNLEKNDIFMLADEVGVGKTPVAQAVMDYYSYTFRATPVVLAPKNVADNMWMPMTMSRDKVFNKVWDFKVHSISELSKRTNNFTAEYFEDKKLLVIDESHYFRNDNNQKTEAFKKLIQPAIENNVKILLLTATPIFNGFSDLINQFALGRKSDDFHQISMKIMDLKNTKDKYTKLVNDKKVYDWLKGRYLARSKKYIISNYNAISEFKFPEIEVENINSSHSNFEEQLIEMVEKMVAGSGAAITKFMLYKRMEESIESFKKSMKLLKERRFSDFITETDFLAIEDENIKVDNSNINNTIRTISDSTLKLNDEILEEAQKMVDGRKISSEEKFSKTLNLIDENGKKGTCIFTTSVTTANALYKAIKAARPELLIGKMSGENFETTSELSGLVRSEEDIATLFAPSKNMGKINARLKDSGFLGEIEDYKIDVLILTDKFAEGINLQQNKMLINYDFPWSPMIVQQRVGRLNRVGSTYETIEIVNLFSSSILENKVKVYQRLIDKDEVAATFQDLPNIFKKIYAEKYGRKFASTGVFEDESEVGFVDIVTPKSDALIEKSRITNGWFTTVFGEQDQLYNLFRVKEKYYLISGMEKVNSASFANMIKLQNILSSNSEFNKTSRDAELIFEEYVKDNYFDKVFTPILHKHINELIHVKKIDEPTKIELVATVFVIKDIDTKEWDY